MNRPISGLPKKIDRAKNRRWLRIAAKRTTDESDYTRNGAGFDCGQIYISKRNFFGHGIIIPIMAAQAMKDKLLPTVLMGVLVKRTRI